MRIIYKINKNNLMKEKLIKYQNNNHKYNNLKSQFINHKCCNQLFISHSLCIIQIFKK